MKSVISVLSLNAEKIKIGLYKIGESDVLQFKRVMNLKIQPDMFNKIFLLLTDQLMEADIKDGEIFEVNKLDEMPKVVIDSFSLIKNLVENNKGTMTKKDFYESYLRQVNCTHRTAENHLAKALALGIVQADGMYSIKLYSPNKEEVINNEERQEGCNKDE